MGLANTWVVLKNSSRPTLRDQAQDQDRQCRDQDQDCKKSVSSGLETKIAVSWTTRLAISGPRWSVGSAVVHYSPSATSEVDVQAASYSTWCS